MYLETLEALRKYKRTAVVRRVVVDDLSPGDVLRTTLEADGLRAAVESGRDAINHVLVASPRLAGHSDPIRLVFGLQVGGRRASGEA
jgi:hypothetical protein